MRPGRRTEGFWWDHAPGCQGSDTTGLGQELSSFSHSSHPRPTHPSWNRFFLAEGATGQTGIVFFLPKSQPSPATSVRVEMEQGRCFPTRSCFAEASQKQKKRKREKKGNLEQGGNSSKIRGDLAVASSKAGRIGERQAISSSVLKKNNKAKRFARKMLFRSLWKMKVIPKQYFLFRG